MKNLQTLLCALAILAIALFYSGCSRAPSDITDPIKEANKKMMEAYANGDTLTLIDFYTTDARLFPANSGILDGKAAIGKFWNATRQMGIVKVNFETTTAQKFGDLAIEEGKYSLFVPNDIMVDQGKYIVTWKHEGGKWKVFRDIWNASTPPPVQRASFNDSVLIVLNQVKPDKVTQFEDFNMNILSPAGTETNPQVKATVRMQKPVSANADGSYTYVYLMDPFKGNLNYSIEYTLNAKFGKEKADEYMKMYLDCLVGGNSKAMLLTETNW
jgi:ketosteroid isomerase-like protein